MSTHNICFCAGIRNIFIWVPFLFRAMQVTLLLCPPAWGGEHIDFGVELFGIGVGMTLFVCTVSCEPVVRLY